MSRRLLASIQLALFALACAPSRATIPPAEPVPSALVTAMAFRYTPGDVSMQDVPLRVAQGTTIEFAPLDPLGNHSMISTDYVDGEPLFSSELIGPGQVAQVEGVDRLAIGTYDFTCNVHEYMAGRLEIIARP